MRGKRYKKEKRKEGKKRNKIGKEVQGERGRGKEIEVTNIGKKRGKR